MNPVKDANKKSTQANPVQTGTDCPRCQESRDRGGNFCAGCGRPVKAPDVIRRELDRWKAEVCTPANEPGFIPEDSSGVKPSHKAPGVMGP